MINNLADEKVAFEITELIKGLDFVKDEINIYCDLMKQMFLTCSNEN